MRVRIITASNPKYWYSSHIGLEFNVEDDFDDEHYYYGSLLPLGGSGMGLVHKIDCEEVKEKVVNVVSELFEKKVIEIRGFSEGEKVHYMGHGKRDNGIIKTISPDGEIFVVYRCADDWENYYNYTGVLTSLKDLKRGWYES